MERQRGMDSNAIWIARQRTICKKRREWRDFRPTTKTTSREINESFTPCLHQPRILGGDRANMKTRISSQPREEWMGSSDLLWNWYELTGVGGTFAFGDGIELAPCLWAWIVLCPYTISSNNESAAESLFFHIRFNSFHACWVRDPSLLYVFRDTVQKWINYMFMNVCQMNKGFWSILY